MAPAELVGLGVVLVVALAALVRNRRRQSSLGDQAINFGTYVLLGTGLSEFVGPGPWWVSLAAGALLAVVHRLAPVHATASVAATALGYSAVRAFVGGMCEPPLTALGVLLTLGLAVAAWRMVSVNSVGAGAAFTETLLDGALIGYGVLKLVWFILTPIGGAVVGFQPMLAWWLVVALFFVLAPAWRSTEPIDAVKAGVALIGGSVLVTRMVILQVATPCSANARAELLTATATCVVGLALAQRKPFARQPNRYVHALPH